MKRTHEARNGSLSGDHAAFRKPCAAINNNKPIAAMMRTFLKGSLLFGPAGLQAVSFFGKRSHAQSVITDNGRLVRLTLAITDDLFDSTVKYIKPGATAAKPSLSAGINTSMCSKVPSIAICSEI